MHPLERAAKIVGSQKTLAEKLGVTPMAVTNWKQRGRLPRTEWTGETAYAVAIEALTGGRVKAEDLCPGLHHASPQPSVGEVA